MKQILISILIFFSISISCVTELNGQFSISAEYRSRFEVRDGYKAIVDKGTSAAVFISQRARFSILYGNKYLKLKFTPQDVRLWGDEELATSTGVFGNRSSIDLLEGYIQVKVIDKLWLSVGRQQLVYDNQRLLAARNWNQLGISYDAVVAKIAGNTWNLHMGGSWNTLVETFIDNTYPANRIKTLNYLWVHRRICSGLDVSFLHIASGKRRAIPPTNCISGKLLVSILIIPKIIFPQMEIYIFNTGKTIPVHLFAPS